MFTNQKSGGTAGNLLGITGYNSGITGNLLGNLLNKPVAPSVGSKPFLQPNQAAFDWRIQKQKSANVNQREKIKLFHFFIQIHYF